MLWDTAMHKDLLDKTPKSNETKAKQKNGITSNNKVKARINSLKKKPIQGKKIFSNYTSEKGLISYIYKMKTTLHQKQKGNRESSKEDLQKVNRYWKKIQYH